MSNLAALQAQIAELQSNLRGTNGSTISTLGSVPVPQNAIPSVSDIKDIVKNAIAAELKDIKALIESNSPKTETKKLTILEAIGLSLTPEEQTWLSTKNVQESIPDFLISPSGSEYIKLFVSELKAAYENKT